MFEHWLVCKGYTILTGANNTSRVMYGVEGVRCHEVTGEGRESCIPTSGDTPFNIILMSILAF
jgi:hypothetical protein